MTEFNEVTITMGDIRRAKMCSKGARAFFKKHGLDWEKFLKEGCSSQDLINTGDEMALQVVRIANGRK